MATDLYRQHFYIDADDIRDVTWDWTEFCADRSTAVASAEILADGGALVDADQVTVHVPAQVDTPTVTIRVQLAAATELTCRALFTNGERKDWTLHFTVKAS